MKRLLMLEFKTNKIRSLTPTPPFLKKNATKVRDIWVPEDHLFGLLSISEGFFFSFVFLLLAGGKGRILNPGKLQ